MPKPGDILCHKEYEFKDGSKKEKLFVVLNMADGNTPCLALMTTSQSKQYPRVNQGCNHTKRCFFVPTKWGNCFTLDTYIQLPRIFEFPVNKLLTGSFAKIVYVSNSISSDCLAQLKNCLKKFKEDLSERHWKLIFKS